jgi:hypothetical protein
MPGPKKTDYSDRIIDITKSNFEFLKTLWGTEGEALRNQLMTSRNESELRRLLGRYNIEVEANTRLMIVDILSAKMNNFVTDAAQDDFYVLVLPPSPRRNPGDDPYKQMQGWLAAQYHAINDSYGM